MSKQTLQLINEEFTIHSLAYDDVIPTQVLSSDIFFIAKTAEELSIVCPSSIVVNSFSAEKHWRALEMIGPLGFSLTGVMSNLSGVLAKAGVSIFAISTYDTDYVLVKDKQVTIAIDALKKDGYLVI